MLPPCRARSREGRVARKTTQQEVLSPASTRPRPSARKFETQPRPMSEVRQPLPACCLALFNNPIVSDFPIVVDVLVASPSCLLPVFPWFDLRGVPEFLLGDIHLEAIGLFVVGQHRPGNRIMIRADAEEAAETQDRVGDFTGELVDHQALDLPDALAAYVIDRHSFHAVAGDEGRRLALLCRCGLLPIAIDLFMAVP